MKNAFMKNVMSSGIVCAQLTICSLAYLPVRRATAIDPASALKSD